MTFIYWLVEYVATLIETFLCYKFSEVFVANNEEINKHRKISNSFEGNMPDCFCTSKEEKVMHGIGIKNVRSIVDKYDGEFILSKEQDKVVANIMLMNKKV